MTVQAALIASVAEVDLQGAWFAAGKAGKVSRAQQGECIQHVDYVLQLVVLDRRTPLPISRLEPAVVMASPLTSPGFMSPGYHRMVWQPITGR